MKILNSPTAELYRKLNHLASSPVITLPRDAMHEYLQLIERRCKGSRQMSETAMTRIPGGVQHNLAFNYPFPLVITRAEGAYLYDIDGNRYIDFLQAGGPTVLGSNYPAVREKIIDLINNWVCRPSRGWGHKK